MTISYCKVTLIYDCEHQTWPLDCMKINNGVKCIIYRSFSLIVIFQRSCTYVRLVALPRPLKWSIIRPNLLLAILMGKVMWSAVSVCFHCSFWTNRSSILIFYVCMCVMTIAYQRLKLRVIGQGQGWARMVMWSVSLQFTVEASLFSGCDFWQH